MEEPIYFSPGRCENCGKELDHPPVKIPTNVEKSPRPLSYYIDYKSVCQNCAVSLLKRRFFDLRAPKMELKKINPKGKDRWVESDLNNIENKE